MRRYQIWVVLFLLVNLLLLTTALGLAENHIFDENEMISPEAMKEDLDYLKKTITQVHPSPYNSLSKGEFNEKWDELYQRVQKPLSYRDFYFTVLEGLYPLHDGHSTAYFNAITERLPYTWRWLEEGIIFTSDYSFVQKGDQLLQIGGTNIEEIFQRLQRIIPAENDYWVKERGQSWLLYRFLLEYLGLTNPDGSVTLTMRTVSGSYESIRALFQPVPTRQSQPPYWYEIMSEDDLAVLYLKQCNNDQGYQELLQKFFDQVHEHGIQRILVDVRDNGGGDSRVIDEFFAYTNISSYRTFGGGIKNSKPARKQDGLIAIIVSNLFPKKKVKVKHVDGPLYTGELYVATSKGTFSSANWFAGVVQDNQIGTIIGEPTGNAPTSYGYPLSFSLPCSNIFVNISHVSWVRPDRTKDDIKTIEPDYYLPLTQEDLLLERDPVIEWLREHK